MTLHELPLCNNSQRGNALSQQTRNVILDPEVSNSTLHLTPRYQIGCEYFRFRNFLKFSILCFAKFSSNFAKFSEKRNKNLGENFAISRNTKSKCGQHFGHFARERCFFLLSKMLTIIYFCDIMFIKSKWILINFHFGQKRFVFSTF